MKTTTILTLGASFALATSASATNLILNGDFATGDFTDWSNTTSSDPADIFTISTGAALSPISNTLNAFKGSNLTQGFTALTDFNFNATINHVALGNGGSRRDLNWSLGGLIFKVDAGGLFSNAGGWTSILDDDTTSLFSPTTGVDYRWELTGSGFDGAGGEADSLDIRIFDGATEVFTATNRTGIAFNAEAAAVDEVDFVMGSNWGTSQYSVDNVSIVPEPSSAALLGLGGLALILRRRK